jgi:hypothetical protein
VGWLFLNFQSAPTAILFPIEEVLKDFTKEVVSDPLLLPAIRTNSQLVLVIALLSFPFG